MVRPLGKGRADARLGGTDVAQVREATRRLGSIAKVAHVPRDDVSLSGDDGAAARPGHNPEHNQDSASPNYTERCWTRRALI